MTCKNINSKIDKEFEEFLINKPLNYINCIYVYDAITDNENNKKSNDSESENLFDNSSDSETDKKITKNKKKKKYIKSMIEKDFF